MDILYILLFDLLLDSVAICHLVWHYELLGLSVYRSVYRIVGFQPHPYNVYSAII